MESNKLFKVEEIERTTGRAKISKIVTFNSIADFVKYIDSHEPNQHFAGKYRSSEKAPNNWSGNMTYQEALEAMRTGWSSGAIALEKSLRSVKTDMQVEKAFKSITDVCGYQPIVPLYLAGAPNCMVRKKQVPKKQKVITINRSLCASGSVSSEKLMHESEKVLQIIYKLEKSGYRINLNLVISCGIFAVKIRLKSAGERLSISKLAFPLVHTAFFRKVFFRFIEVSEFTTGFHSIGYGAVPEEFEFRDICTRNKEIHLPTLLYGKVEEEVKTLTADELLERLR